MQSTCDSDLINVRFRPLCGLKADVCEVRDVARLDKLETLMVSRVVARALAATCNARACPF